MSELKVIDFDRTIFDTDAYTDAFVGSLGAAGLLTSVEVSSFNERVQSPDSVDVFGMLHDEFGVEVERLVELASDLEGDFVYGDARRLLDRDQTNTLILTTAASVLAQRCKIEQAGLSSKAVRVISGNKGRYLLEHVVRDEKTGLLTYVDNDRTFEGMQRVHLVDDRYSHLEPLIGVKDMETTLIVRPDAKYQPTQDQRNSVRVVESLDEIATPFSLIFAISTPQSDRLSENYTPPPIHTMNWSNFAP